MIEDEMVIKGRNDDEKAVFSTNKNTNKRTAIREHDNEGQKQEVNEVPIKNKSSKKTKTSINQHEVEEYEVFSQGTSMSLEIKIYYLIIVMGKIDRLEKTIFRNISSYGIVLTSLPTLSSRPTTVISELILTTPITESRPTTPIMELRPLTLTIEQEVIVIDEEHNPSKKLSEMKHHENQLRQQTENNNDVGLTPKVFMEWYIQEVSERKWTNSFVGNHHTMIQHKMKDLRGTSAAAKRSQKVKECYYKLYDEDENVIENIVKQAFPTLSHDNELLFNDIYVYTASDLLLNNKSIELDDSISIIREEIPEMKKKVVVEKDNEKKPRSEEAYEQNFDELFDHSD
ncbi:hypothetical protein RhiirA1_458336 [Rhizophagus irregularis]|uniref:Uncharacterized protein n=1 Tax=Rhizophagus irregularis TaxID=588596 RepID=A0A2N0RW45_9GLOM|nr:hypothetical protein RhiirA1_458336 [Rhizophagus irregularis]